ncbi:hypothetical protein GBA52_028939 [Prunus armeniaca]|nr:hypothetical protein GBA52_028939 [Prunus armeniaca]
MDTNQPPSPSLPKPPPLSPPTHSRRALSRRHVATVGWALESASPCETQTNPQCKSSDEPPKSHSKCPPSNSQAYTPSVHPIQSPAAPHPARARLGTTSRSFLSATGNTCGAHPCVPDRPLYHACTVGFSRKA